MVYNMFKFYQTSNCQSIPAWFMMSVSCFSYFIYLALAIMPQFVYAYFRKKTSGLRAPRFKNSVGINHETTKRVLLFCNYLTNEWR